MSENKNTEKGSPKYAAQAAWRERNPLKRWAHVCTAAAIRRGLLVVPDRCENCNEPGRLEAHHDNHRAVLDVKFWCAPCHRRFHAVERKGGAE